VKRLGFRNQKPVVDKKLLLLAVILTVAGLVAVADASIPQAMANFNDKFYYLKQQVLWALAGIFLMFVFSKIDYIFWKKLACPLFILSLAFLVLVLFPEFGLKTLGARRWFSLGLLSFQPSEIVKFTTVLYFARLSEMNKKMLAYFIPLVFVAVLIMLEPDLGTTVVIVATGLVQVFVSGVNIFYFLGSLVVGFLASVLLILTSEYRQARLTTFLTQTHDPLGKSYHIRQVLLSLGLGGIFGTGLGASRQKYLFLPEAATDSIFAVIAEEMGFVGASILIFLFFYFALRAYRISFTAPDKFSKIFALGLTSWIVIQTLLNLGSMLALVPLTGVPLPFISYGGTSLIMTLSVTGILLNISRYAEQKKEKRKR
jgi:cell division protein FtsW